MSPRRVFIFKIPIKAPSVIRLQAMRTADNYVKLSQDQQVVN